MKLLKNIYIYFFISALVLVPGIWSLMANGLRPAIDFTGGSLLEVLLVEGTAQPELDKVNTAVGEIYEVSTITQTEPDQYIFRGKNINNAQKNEVITKLGEELGEVQEVRFETVGPVLGKELLDKTLVAIFLVAGVITIYVWRQFKEIKFGVCAILAMFHDTLVLLGVFSLLGLYFHVEVDVLFVTALLTTLSFSVHDTIVVYDRIRELSSKHPRKSLEMVANAAVIETLGRSVNNSITIIIMLLALVFLGGATIRWFAVALLVGAISGTYSSTFTAVPLLLLWEKLKRKKS